ncbi:MAG: hypothetical protein U1E78_02845 [Gammaproteobacteria bacterium]
MNFRVPTSGTYLRSYELPPTFFELRAESSDGQANPENSAVKGTGILI